MGKKNFKSTHSLDDRKSESERILSKYPDRIPIIAEIENDSSLTLDKKKYLVPNDLTVGQFVYVIRKRIKLAPEKSIFMFIGDTIPSTGALLSQMYKEKKDEDGFLYITVTEENTFG